MQSMQKIVMALPWRILRYYTAKVLPDGQSIRQGANTMKINDNQ